MELLNPPPSKRGGGGGGPQPTRRPAKKSRSVQFDPDDITHDVTNHANSTTSGEEELGTVKIYAGGLLKLRGRRDSLPQ